MKDISLHILDIAENSISAGATLVKIRIRDDSGDDSLTFEIEDDGRGIREDLAEKVLDPFYTSRTTRKVGLGLSLLAQSARETGGDVSVHSREGMGTTVSAGFRPSHIDMKPVGDLAETFLALIVGNPDIDFFFSYDKGDRGYSLDTREIKAALEDVPINAPAVISALREDLTRSLKDIMR